VGIGPLWAAYEAVLTMKLFHYDDKHDRVLGEIDLGRLSESEEVLLRRVLDWLDYQQVTTRYSSLMLAEAARTEYDEENGFERVYFD